MEVLELVLKTDWMPRSGPVTLVPQITVALYLLTMALCLTSGWLARGRKAYSGFDVRFWIGMGVVFACLAFNRAFGVQLALTSFLRLVALKGFWYNTRRSVQEPVVIGLLILAVGFFLLLRWVARPIWQNYKLASFGLAILLTHLLVRAISFHNMDQLLYDSFMGLYVHQIIEITGIMIVLIAAVRYIFSVQNS